MPIKLPSSLPAFNVLSKEGVMVMSEDEATRQDIRPLQIGLLNLMPKKNSNGEPICKANWFHPTSNRAFIDKHQQSRNKKYSRRAYEKFL